MTITSVKLSDHVINFSFESHVLKCGFLKSNLFFVLSDGRVIFPKEDGSAQSFSPHKDGILVAATNNEKLVTGGEDGKIFEILSDGSYSLIVEEKGKWIDALVIHESGSIAWGVGKNIKVQEKAKNTQIHSINVPSTSQGIAFAPKGFRLAIAHIDGATCWYPRLKESAELFTWKGPHIDVTFSPDNRFLITSMQENQLHGWKLIDKSHMRMSGYPSKIRSFSWSYDGLWLATSGAEGAIVWPFAKDGPMGKAPRECGIRPAKVSAVAFHPKAPVLAIGYEDGWILLVRFTDNAEMLVRGGAEYSNSEITNLCWDDKGEHLAFGSDDGKAGLLTLPS